VSSKPAHRGALEIWGGVECTVNRVGDQWFDQVKRSGHDRRIDDLDAFAALGISAVRYPILWERHAPRSLDEIDWRWSDVRLARLRACGIRPIVGLLHHGSGPAYTDLLDDGFPDKLARYAGIVAARYPWVTDFTPVNEPLTTARFSALYGHWYPHHASDASFAKALINQLHGTVLAMQAIRRVTPHARLVQTEDCGRTFGTSRTGMQVAYEEQRRWITCDLLVGEVTRRHPMRAWLRRAGVSDEQLEFFCAHPCPPDVVGLNYYVTSDRYLDHRLDRYPASTHGGNGQIRYADVEAVRVASGVVGHEEHLHRAWQRYGKPVAITEAHLGCTREEQMRWLLEAWRGAHAARARGAIVEAVTAWALLGSYDWDSLVTCNAGHYEPGAYDLRGPGPRRTAVADLVSTLAAGSAPEHPALSAPGWWHRPERLGMAAAVTVAARRAEAPLLVIGASGTLASAFGRIAARRGLAVRLVGRAEIDIGVPTAIDHVLRSIKPWAVINTAGYVRVDAAESNPAECSRINVDGAVNLAAACRRHRLPFVTFSSDLVFDGASRRPYTEIDTPAPLNVYGSTKAEAERRVLNVMPGTLVVRTSAFFGPWDEANFVASLLRALDAGHTFAAPADSIVSPTYVPELVDTTLDLLLDGEQGIWHLANGGAFSWYEFARLAAAACGRPADAIRPVATVDVWGPAARPPFSVLGSCRATIMRPLAAALDAFVESVSMNAREGLVSCASR
jgi:dTDP-4-dehydrorhamnose reductase